MPHLVIHILCLVLHVLCLVLHVLCLVLHVLRLVLHVLFSAVLYFKPVHSNYDAPNLQAAAPAVVTSFNV